MTAQLSLPYHRGTTRHVASLFPFGLQRPTGPAGVFMGVDLLAGGAGFWWDPFEAYAAGVVTNPNVWVLGEPGHGKSALVKSLLYRMACVYGPQRWFAIVDPKGEYGPLADTLGLTVVRLAPGGATRINPLAPAAAGDVEPADGRVRRAADLVQALTGAVLGRPLTPDEDVIAFAAVHDALTGDPRHTTLRDVAAELLEPSAALADRVRRSRAETAAAARPVAYALDKLLARNLRGMFDGPSTVAVGGDGPGVVVDLSGVYHDSAALPVVMVATVAWLRELMVAPGPPRVQVFEEAWAVLGLPQGARFAQAAQKLGRSYGVANLFVVHRPSDPGAQADDGTAAAKIADGLAADAATKIILRQAPDQAALAARLYGLTDPERHLVTSLVRGRALWRLADRAAVVHHHLAAGERALCDTDHRMRPVPHEFTRTEGASSGNSRVDAA